MITSQAEVSRFDPLRSWRSVGAETLLWEKRSHRPIPDRPPLARRGHSSRIPRRRSHRVLRVLPGWNVGVSPCFPGPTDGHQP